eukprot:449931_1
MSITVREVECSIELFFVLFEGNHDILTEANDIKPICPLTKCDDMIERNRRNRSKGEDETNMIKHQLLDKIHSQYIHSFDTGYKMMRKDREHIVNDDKTEEFTQLKSKCTLDTDAMERECIECE